MTDANQQDSKDEKAEEKREPLRYSIIAPPPEIPRGKLAQADQKNPKGEKTAEQPEPPRYSIVAQSPEIPRGKLTQVGQKNPKSEKTEEQPEPPRYSIVAPPPEIPRGKLAQTGQQDPKDEKTEEQQEPLRYAIVEPPPPSPPDNFTQANLRGPVGASADAKRKNPTREPAVAPPPLAKAPVEGMRKSILSPTKVYIWAGVGLGVLFGCVVAVVLSHMGAPSGPYDLGSANSEAVGMKGHLSTKWDKKLQYRLTLEPSDPDRRAGFALAVAHSPHPLSIEIHLQDAQGFVLCSREILLKYDAGSALAPAAANPETPAGQTDADGAAGSQPPHGVGDLLAAQEAERELGKDVFRNEIGPDGQVAAIDAQGEIPCSEKAYASISSWSFTPNFPSLAEQDELRKRQEEAQANGGVSAAEEAPAARKKAARIAAPKILSFSIEGDDVIVDYDVSRGIIETRAGKTFIFDKTSGDIANPRWQDYPIDIHYRCDQTATCMLTHSGVGTLRVRVSR